MRICACVFVSVRARVCLSLFDLLMGQRSDSRPVATAGGVAGSGVGDLDRTPSSSPSSSPSLEPVALGPPLRPLNKCKVPSPLPITLKARVV